MFKQSPIPSIAMVLVACLALLAQNLGAAPGDTVALGSIESSSTDPRYAYLAPIIEGLLIYDLGEKGQIALVERNRLGQVLAEQELSLSGLLDPAKAIGIGSILGAQWLVYGTYSVLGGEVLLTLQLTNSSSGQTLAVRERGTSEHVVHKAAEQLIAKISGRTVAIADSTNSRSILNLRDERPGSIALYSRLERAKILIDGEFAGFTQADETQEMLFDNLEPGVHTIGTYLGRGWGKLTFPGPRFKAWEVTVDVRPGRRVAVLDETLHISDAVAKYQDLAYDRINVPSLAPGYSLTRQGTMTQRDGTTLAWTVKAAVNQAGTALDVEILGAKKSISLDMRSGSRSPNELRDGPLRLDFALTRRNESWDIQWELSRTDFSQSDVILE